MANGTDKISAFLSATDTSKGIKNALDTEIFVPEEEVVTLDEHFNKKTAIGNNVSMHDVSEEPEASKIPIRADDDTRVEHEEVRIINPDFPLPHGMRIRSLRETGSITIGNRHVDISMLSPNMCILGTQVKCIATAGIGADYWNACYYFDSVNIQDIATDLLDVENIGAQAFFDANATSAITPGGVDKYVRIYLDANATTDAQYEVVVYILEFIDCSTA